MKTTKKFDQYINEADRISKSITNHANSLQKILNILIENDGKPIWDNKRSDLTSLARTQQNE